MAARRELQAVATREGQKIRRARRRRRLTQKALGRRVGLDQTTISRLERGDGASLSLMAWQQVALVLQLHLELTLG